MQVQNPDYKYYKQLAGTWKSDDGACVLTLTETVGINVTYGGAVLDGQYGVQATGPMMGFMQPGPMGTSMMGMAGFPGNMTYQRDPSEDIQLKLGDRSLKNGDQVLYNIEFAWHDLSDRIHVELSNVATGAKTDIILHRENVSAAAAGGNEGEVQCECGMHFSSKFCPNCGKMRPVNNTFTCSCGYTGTVSRFCPECGRAIAANNAAVYAAPAPSVLTDDEKNAKLNHGWRDSRGQFQVRFKDGQYSTRYVATAPFGGPGGIEMPTGEEYRIYAKYEFAPWTDGGHAWPDLTKLISHPGEEFAVFPRKYCYSDSTGKNIFAIEKIWYGSNTLHLDLLKWAESLRFTVDLELDESVSIPEPEPEPRAGWTCPQCGATLQTGEKCTECGAEIKTEPLFAISEYMSTNPPRYDGVRVWRFSDTQLIMQQGKTFRFIPATVIEPAMEIIRKYEIDKWEEYQGRMSGMMGGSQSVSYWNGEKMVGTSTDHMAGASGAYSALYGLFTTAK